MRFNVSGLLAAGMICVFVATPAQAADPSDTCEAGKNDTAGKYAACLHKAQAKFVKGGSVDTAARDAALVKCTEKYSGKWQSAEDKAGGACPSDDDETGIQDFLDACAMSVENALGGGTLPLDVVTCNGNLGTCNTNLATCSGDLSNTNADLGTCNGDLGTCNTNLATCSGDLSGTNADLTTCNGNLGTCNTNLATCSGDLSSTDADLATCNGSLGTCNTNLATCSGDLSSTDADLATCNGNLGTCTTNLATCSGDLATANSGTAAVGDVLVGKTFTSTAGLGATGTMPNNGAVTLTPTTSDQAIAAGYHNGSGKCSGDADLVAGNIKNGVSLFGVAGTLSSGGLAKSGQTICYNTAGSVIACAGTGHDGELQKGVAASFTDNADGTITDNLTGLMWEKLSDDGSIHDKDTLYTWDNAFASKVATLNSGSFAGYSDWRVPNVRELQTLVSFGAQFPATYSAFNTGCVAACTVTTCSCMRSHYYWSSSTHQGSTTHAWTVIFGDGLTTASAKATGFHVRAVRAGS